MNDYGRRESLIQQIVSLEIFACSVPWWPPEQWELARADRFVT